MRKMASYDFPVGNPATTRPARWLGLCLALTLCGPAAMAGAATAHGDPEAPASREYLAAASDDFEAPDWAFDPASGRGGKSADGHWRGSWRGAPDVVETAPTPGSPGERSLRLRLDGSPREGPSQGDLVNRAHDKSGAPALRADRRPAIEAIVRLPPAKAIAEAPAALTSFALRLSVVSGARDQAYYPSLIVRQTANDSVLLARLGDGYVRDVRVRDLPADGGPLRLRIAFSADGVARYYASPGLAELSEKDRVWSSQQFPTEHPSGRNPRMRRIKYHFLSLGAHPSGAATPPFLVDAIRVTTSAPDAP